MCCFFSFPAFLIKKKKKHSKSVRNEFNNLGKENALLMAEPEEKVYSNV